MNDSAAWLVVGLGNPGPEYETTRHNAGYLTVDVLADRMSSRLAAHRRAHAVVAEGRIAARRTVLAKPRTYMNESGGPVAALLAFYKVEVSQLVVVHDELDLPFGTVRGKTEGGAGGHNGLRSLIAGTGGNDFARVRLGVGRPPSDFRGDQADWVLARFSEPDADVDALVDRGVAMTEAALDQGIEEAIARFHASAPGSRASRRRERNEETSGGGDEGDTDTRGTTENAG